MKKSLAVLLIFIAWSCLLIAYKNDQKNSILENGGKSVNRMQIISVQNSKEYENYHNAYSLKAEAYGNLEKIEGLDFGGDMIYGGIVSHHFLVAPEIAEFFAGLKGRPIETIVIIGPNHFSYGEGDIQVAQYPYKTPWGILESDSGSIEKLLKNNFIKNEEIPFNREHSISTLAGFIKYYLPEAKIVPVILKRNTSKEKAESLAEALSESLPERSLVIASIDFSHHLNETAADFHDTLSLSVIKSFDYDRLQKLEIDSPSSVYALLKYLEKRGAQKMAYKNINSADFSNRPDLADVTSYVFAYFGQGAAERENIFSLLAFGDMTLGGDIKKMTTEGSGPFDKIRAIDGNFFRGSDFVLANFEGSYDKENCNGENNNFDFVPETGKDLWENKVNFVNLANISSNICYTEEKNNIKKYLDSYNISSFGGTKTEESYNIQTIGNKKIAFIGIEAAGNNSIGEEFYLLIKKLKSDNDFVVANIHWRGENANFLGREQVNSARNLIDSGADIIIGNNSLNILPMEMYKEKVIFYSLGNFIPKKTDGAREGLGVGIVFDEKGKNKFSLFPFNITDNQPELLNYAERVKFCNDFLGDLKTAEVCYFEN